MWPKMTRSVAASHVSVVSGIEVNQAMKGAFFAQFFYRINPDKTIESICGFCFMGSRASDNHADLQAWESAHRCFEERPKIA
jgi:hypothetical protein